MSDTEYIGGMALVAMLVSYLCIMHHRREIRRAEQEEPPGWTGKPIDVTPLKPAMEELHRDYLAGRQRPRGVWFHRKLMGSARRTLEGLAYFQEKEAPDAENRSAEN
jgi:hypothetical protein